MNLLLTWCLRRLGSRRKHRSVLQKVYLPPMTDVWRFLLSVQCDIYQFLTCHHLSRIGSKATFFFTLIAKLLAKIGPCMKLVKKVTGTKKTVQSIRAVHGRVASSSMYRWHCWLYYGPAEIFEYKNNAVYSPRPL